MSPDPGTPSTPRALAWECDRQDRAISVSLEGDIDENACLAEILSVISGEVRLDLAGVRRINSAGVRDWVNFMRGAKDLAERITLSRCSPAMVMQMNMIANFRGDAEVDSIFAPFACPRCEGEEDILIPLCTELQRSLPEGLPGFTCKSCGAPLELDDIPERYFAFLKRRRA